ncbi:MAG: GAF domain-containing protein [Anaerolineales bacterium]|nr:GAF domain-containing protein [Anaerolineales bacterium]
MLQRFHEPKHIYVDPLERQEARLILVLVTIALAVGAIALLVLPLASLFVDGISIGLLLAVAVPAVVIVMAARQLVQVGLVNYAALLLVAGAVVLNSALFLASPTLGNPIIASFGAIVVLTGLFFGQRAVVISAIIYIGLLVIIGIVQFSTNYFPKVDDERTAAIQVIAHNLIALLILVVILYNYLTATTSTIRTSYQALQAVEAYGQVSRYLRDSDDPVPAVLRLVTDEIRDAFGVYSVRLFVGPLEDMRLVGATGLVGERLLSQQLILDTKGSSTTALAVRNKAPVITTLSDSKIQQVDFHLTTRIELALPLLAGGQVYGVLVLQHDREDTFSNQQVYLLNGLADQLTMLVQRIRVDEQMTKLEADVAEAHRQTQERQRELRDLVQTTAQQEWLNFLTTSEQQTNFRWDGKSITAWEPEATPPKTMPILEQDDTEKQKITVPIVLGNRAMGELVFEASSTVQWTYQTLEVVQEVANRLALALDNARLFNQSQMTALREQAVGSVASELQSFRDVDTLVKQASGLFSQILGAEQTAIRLVRD